MSDTRTFHKGDDGLTYDDEGYFVYTGISPLSEETEVEEETET